MVYGLGFRVQA